MSSRRRFLRHTCGAGATALTMASTGISLGLARSAAAESLSDYRALVCILLAGGNDSFNMLLPNDSDQLTEYGAIRADLALDPGELLALPGTDGNGRSHALHPGMADTRDLYSAGELAFVPNVGTLLEKVDAAAVEGGAAELPLGLYSHADQIAQWQTALPDARVAIGWGGRVADLMQNVNRANGISMNISLAGTNVFQSGQSAVEYSISAENDGAVGINAYDDGSDFGPFRKRMIDELLAVEQSQLFRGEYARRMKSAIENEATFVAALTESSAPSTEFSANPFSASLRQIARVVAAREALGACRQTFFVTVGGWDHHDEVLDNQAAMLPMISRGLKEFRDALVELGLFDAVTTFTISDFGRTLTSNGKGSDHGWAGHHMVMGGGVRGGALYGDYPLLSAMSPLDVGRGVYVPTTASDEYFAELALWFGVAPSELDRVLPNVRRFYSPESAEAPMGFMT